MLIHSRQTCFEPDLFLHILLSKILSEIYIKVDCIFEYPSYNSLLNCLNHGITDSHWRFIIYFLLHSVYHLQSKMNHILPINTPNFIVCEVVLSLDWIRLYPNIIINLKDITQNIHINYYFVIIKCRFDCQICNFN